MHYRLKNIVGYHILESSDFGVTNSKSSAIDFKAHSCFVRLWHVWQWQVTPQIPLSADLESRHTVTCYDA